MARRGSKDREQHWRGVIQDQKTSGLSISAFCRERKVPAASFYNWRRKLADRQLRVAVEPGKTAAQFVSLDLPPPNAVTRTGCEVVLANGCRIIVPPQCDADWLLQILGALQERSC